MTREGCNKQYNKEYNKQYNKEYNKGEEWQPLNRRTYIRYIVEVLRKHFNPIYKDIVSDYDFLGEILFRVMLKDMLFDGRGNRDGYLRKHARWATLNYLRKKTARKRNRIKYVEEYGDLDNRRSIVLWKTAKSNTLSKSYVEKIFNESDLTSVELSRVKQYYIDGINITEIAKIENVSRQAIHKAIVKSIKKMRRHWAPNVEGDVKIR